MIYRSFIDKQSADGLVVKLCNLCPPVCIQLSPKEKATKSNDFVAF